MESLASLMETTAGMTTPRSDSTFCLVGQPSNLVDLDGVAGLTTWSSRREKKKKSTLFVVSCCGHKPSLPWSVPCVVVTPSICSLSVVNYKQEGTRCYSQSSPFHLPSSSPAYPCLGICLLLSHFERTRRQFNLHDPLPTSARLHSALTFHSPAPPNKTYLDRDFLSLFHLPHSTPTNILSRTTTVPNHHTKHLYTSIKMKTSAILVLAGALAVRAQFPENFPSCGVSRIS